MQVDRLQAAKGAFHHGQRFVCLDRGSVGEGLFGQAGSHGIEAVEGDLLRDLLMLSGEGEPVVGDRQIEVLGHLVPVEHSADGHADLGRAA